MLMLRIKFGILVFLIITLCSSIWAAPKAKETNTFRFHPITRAQYEAIMGITGGKPVVSEARLIASGIAALKGLAAGVATAFAASSFWAALTGTQTNITQRENFADGYPLCLIESDGSLNNGEEPGIGENPLNAAVGQRQLDNDDDYLTGENWNRKGVNGHLNCVVVVRRDETENSESEQPPETGTVGNYPNPWQYPWPQYPFPYPYPFPPFIPPNLNERKSVQPSAASYAPYPPYWYYPPPVDFASYNYYPYNVGYRDDFRQKEEVNGNEVNDSEEVTEVTEAPKQSSSLRRRLRNRNKQTTKTQRRNQQRRKNYLPAEHRSPKFNKDVSEARTYSHIQSYPEAGYEPTIYPQMSYPSTYPKVSYTQPMPYSAPVYIESTQDEK